MTPDDSPNAGAGGNAKALDPVSQKRAIASKLRGARKREFAMLRERMRGGGKASSTIAGIRGLAVRDRPTSDKTLEKIERIGAHLEALWNLGAAKPATLVQTTPAKQTAASSAPPPQTSLNNLASSTGSSARLWSQPISQIVDPGPLSMLLDLPSKAQSPPVAQLAVEAVRWRDDPVIQEITDLLGAGKYPAVQSLILSSLDPHSDRNPLAYIKALILLDTYRLLGDMDGFDDAVLAYVYWWNDLTPSWQSPAPADRTSPWVLQGDIHGAKSLKLPELDRSKKPQTMDIDCSALRHMDPPAMQALLQWLSRAKTRNYEVCLVAPSPLVYLLWTTMNLEKAAQVRKFF